MTTKMKIKMLHDSELIFVEDGKLENPEKTPQRQTSVNSQYYSEPKHDYSVYYIYIIICSPEPHMLGIIYEIKVVNYFSFTVHISLPVQSELCSGFSSRLSITKAKLCRS